ncbi:MAG TPA: hypothetical protein VMG10_05030 [Gemmataceae bacterium]|nr:hypothetical protein [Gemmataceae bacterium]
MSDRPVSFRFDAETKAMLERFAAWKGGNQTIILTQLIRDAFHANETAIRRFEKRRAESEGEPQ